GLVLRKGRLGRDRLGLPLGIDMPVVFAARKARQALPDAAVARGEIALVERGELADAGNTVTRQPALHRAADAPQPADRLIREKGLGLGMPDDRKTARLIEIGGELRQKFVVAEADRGGDAELVLDPPRQRGEKLRRRRAVQGGRAGQVEKGFV